LLEGARRILCPFTFLFSRAELPFGIMMLIPPRFDLFHSPPFSPILPVKSELPFWGDPVIFFPPPPLFCFRLSHPLELSASREYLPLPLFCQAFPPSSQFRNIVSPFSGREELSLIAPERVLFFWHSNGLPEVEDSFLFALLVHLAPPKSRRLTSFLSPFAAPSPGRSPGSSISFDYILHSIVVQISLFLKLSGSLPS